MTKETAQAIADYLGTIAYVMDDVIDPDWYQNQMAADLRNRRKRAVRQAISEHVRIVICPDVAVLLECDEVEPEDVQAACDELQRAAPIARRVAEIMRGSRSEPRIEGPTCWEQLTTDDD